MNDFINVLTTLNANIEKLHETQSVLLSVHQPFEPLTIKQFCEQFPAFNSQTIREWRRTDFNGFASVCAQIGKTIYIDLPKFKDWFNDQKGH